MIRSKVVFASLVLASVFACGPNSQESTKIFVGGGVRGLDDGPNVDPRPEFTIYRAHVPAQVLGEQLWARNRAGIWFFVDGASQFDKFGIAQDQSNVVDVPWESERAFLSTTYLGEADQHFWIRVDTATGVDGRYPEVPLSANAALRLAFENGSIVPIGATGWAVLKQQGILEADTGIGSTHRYELFRARLPTSELNGQIWACENAPTQCTYVRSPSQYNRFGIAADESNVKDVPFGSVRAFRGTAFIGDENQIFWVRSDSVGGIDTSYPEVPASATQALKDAYASGLIVPDSITGWAVLLQQGVIQP